MNRPSATPGSARSANPLARAQCSTHTSPVSEFQFGGQFLWHPTPELIAQSNLQRFIQKHGLGSDNELMRRATTDIAWLWNTVLCDLSMTVHKPHSHVLDLTRRTPM